MESGLLADQEIFHLMQPVFEENVLTPGAYIVTNDGLLEIDADNGNKAGIYRLELQITDTK